MKISAPCVISLTWTLSDTLSEVLDELDSPVEFFVGGQDLIVGVENALMDKNAGDIIEMQIEPEEAFGDFDADAIFLEHRSLFPAELEVGMLIERTALPKGSKASASAKPLFTVSEIYPEHIVLDGNHPLAGIALRLKACVHGVREATPEEQKAKTCGARFFLWEQ